MKSLAVCGSVLCLLSVTALISVVVILASDYKLTPIVPHDWP